MKLKEITDFIDSEIPRNLALENDKIAFQTDYNLNQEINHVKIFMDILPDDDNFSKDTLVITHHPPLFKPKTPTFTVHSNWDIIEGGANEALCDSLNLNVKSVFDESTGIGRICECEMIFEELRKVILNNFKDARIVNTLESNTPVRKVGVISGFGLKSPKYIQLAHEKELDILISGDLTQETAIMANNLNQTLIDLGHHESEVPGLFKLKEVIKKTNIDCEVITKTPINKL